MLGVEPAWGSFESLARPDAGPVAVLSYGLWQRRFGGDPGVVGQKILLNGRPVSVAAIAGPGFLGSDRVHSPQIWVPLATYRDVAVGVFAKLGSGTDRRRPWLELVGRLAPGRQLEPAAEGLGLVARRLEESYPEENQGKGVVVLPLEQIAFGPGMRHRVVRYSVTLMAAAALVLLAACGNVAGVLIARGLTRQGEMAMRRAVGATRMRLVRLVVTESLVLGGLGGVAGLAVARLLRPLLEHLQAPVGHVGSLAFEPWVFGFALAAGLLSGLLFGLTAALRSTRVAAATILKGPVAPRVRRLGWLGLRDLLAVAQIALALLILAAAVLLLGSLHNLQAIDPGFDPGPVFAAGLDLDAAGYPGSAVGPFYRELAEGLQRLPGVDNASLAAALPMAGAGLEVQLSVEAEGAVGALPEGANHALVGKGLFDTLGIALLEGRDFEDRDTTSAPGVVVVNGTLARQVWPDRPALGQRLRLLQTPEPFEVIGIVADSKYRSLREVAAPTLYLFHGQAEKSFLGSMLAPTMTFLVRSSRGAEALGEPVRRAVGAADPLLPLLNPRPLVEDFSASVRTERQLTGLFSAFAVLAVGLAMLGLGGVVAHGVTERRRELGIRLALGATPSGVRRLVLGRALLLGSLGCALGSAAAVGLGRLLASQLYGITPGEPLVYAVAALVLLASSVAVSDGPARRAAKTPPRESLLS